MRLPQLQPLLLLQTGSVRLETWRGRWRPRREWQARVVIDCRPRRGIGTQSVYRSEGLVRCQWNAQCKQEPRRHVSMGTPEGRSGADDKVVLASTGREAYAGGGFHSLSLRGGSRREPRTMNPRTTL